MMRKDWLDFELYSQWKPVSMNTKQNQKQFLEQASQTVWILQLGAVVIVPVIAACLLLAFADITYVFVAYGRQDNHKLHLCPIAWHLEIECFFSLIREI